MILLLTLAGITAHAVGRWVAASRRKKVLDTNGSKEKSADQRSFPMIKLFFIIRIEIIGFIGSLTLSLCKI